MAENTKIEWAHHTMNFWIGCTKVGPGCDFCYAEASMSKRLKRVEWGPGAPRRQTSEGNRRQPLKWQKNAAAFFAEHGQRQRVFCSSLADVFDNEVPDEWRAEIWDTIRATPDLDWILVTKRIGNVAKMAPPGGFPRNVILLATIVNQDEADRDIPKLVALKYAGIVSKIGLSMEPLLGRVTLRRISTMMWPGAEVLDALTGHLAGMFGDPAGQTGALDWVIVGGESGDEARPMHPQWARWLRDQCAETGVPFHFKQHGEFVEIDGIRCTGHHGPRFDRDGTFWLGIDGSTSALDDRNASFGRSVWGSDSIMKRIGKKAAGRLLDGIEHNGFPVIGGGDV